MIRPGLFFKERERLRSWAAFCCLSACFALIPARKVRAETAAGLDAQGVSVFWALHNPLHLDVRDARARPVSARLIEKQIKSAQAKSAVLGAYASRLPYAKTFARFAEFLPGLKLFLAGCLARRPWASRVVRVAPKAGPKAQAAALAARRVPSDASFFASSYFERVRAPQSSAPLPLRC